MRRSLKVLVVMTVLTLATIGLAGVASADETHAATTLADGTYPLTLPGLGTFTLDVAGASVTVAAPGTAFDGATTRTGERSSPPVSSPREARGRVVRGVASSRRSTRRGQPSTAATWTQDAPPLRLR
jgi:hypothetical protein